MGERDGFDFSEGVLAFRGYSDVLATDVLCVGGFAFDLQEPSSALLLT